MKPLVKTYMITYDLSKPGQDYSDFKKILTEDISNGVWCHFWDSSYLFQTNLTANEAMDKLRPAIDSTDRVIIVEAAKDHQGWMTDKQWDYINKMF
ncbi:hypothetical protein ORR04_05345 [Levilactobacillus brevis]|uniref:SinR family protein n=1 Tax=Levilactobacillus brevis TaxID=1580 RepID=A0AB38X7B3_LEVBR|nr:hypothetical protein [Levilactobacillus brevis]WAD02604.1 hypothetical protein ORR04_05345 [Levilactobacillus brevis]